MDLVSVIIPVYNAEKYLKRCIDSVLNQTYSNCEILLIDNNSTDNSQKILQRYQQIHDKVSYHSCIKQGVSAARNLGLELTKGKWICFVDADDNIEPQFISSFASLTKNGGVQLGIVNANNIYEDGSSAKRLQLKSGIFNFSDKPEQAVTELMQFKWDYSNWNKIYNADIIRQHDIRFNEDIHIGEDLLFNLEYLHFVSMVAVSDECLYNYYLHPASVMSNYTEEPMLIFNKIYKAYSTFCQVHKMKAEATTFQKEISRMYYFQLVNKKLQKEREKGSGFFKRIQALTKILRTVDSGVFFYKMDLEKNKQTFKRKLLSNGHYKLFSIIAVLGSSSK